MNYLRLKKQTDFQRLFHKGKRAFATSVALLYCKSNVLMMGISVGKKHGKSVTRNRIKRLLREAFRSVRKNIKGSYRILLLPRATDEYSFHTFERDLQWLIKKENL